MKKMTQMNAYRGGIGARRLAGGYARGLAEEQGPQMKRITQMNAYRGGKNARGLADEGGTNISGIGSDHSYEILAERVLCCRRVYLS
jgi:ribosomal protein S13